MPRPSYSRYICFPDFIGGYSEFPEHVVNRGAQTVELNLDQFYNLHLIFGGKGYVMWEGRKFELSRGNGFLFGPGTAQRYGSDTEQPWDIRWIHFFGSHLEALLDGKGTHEVWLFSFTDVVRAQELAHAMIQLGRHYRVEDELRMSSLLYELLIHIEQTSTRLNVPADNARAKIQQAANYVSAKCGEAITLEDMAAVSGYSAHYFSRKFHQLIGKKPMEFLQESRVLYAKRLLVSTNLSIKQIALEAGFSQSSYFIHCFRKYESMTPEQFRLSYQGSSK